MVNYEQIVNNFIAELEQTIPVERKEYDSSVYKLKTGKYLIYIYLPCSNRQSGVEELATIHLDIDLLISDQKKILNRLNGIYGLGERVYARNTVVARVDKKVALNFLADHHLQVPIPGKYRYGLFYEGEMISLAVFSGGRLMREEPLGYRSFELIRFCHKANILVVGGLSKLIKAFVSDFKPQDIMTYCDLDWTEKSSLEKIGFQVVGQIDPQCFYVMGNKRYTDFSAVDGEFYKVMNRGSLKLKLLL